MFVLLKSTNTLTQLNKTCVNIVRNGHHLRGKPPGVAKSLQQRLEGKNQIKSQHNFSYKLKIF